MGDALRKVRVLFLSAALLGTIPAYADNLGVQGGFNFASASVIDITGTVVTAGTTTTRLMGGLFYDTRIYGKQWLLQLEATYVSAAKGSVANLEYLVVPLLLKYKFDIGSFFAPFLAAGPDFRLKVSGPQATSTDYGIELGGGLDVPLGLDARFVVNARYALGLTNVIDPTLNPPPSSFKVRGIYLMAGFAVEI